MSLNLLACEDACLHCVRHYTKKHDLKKGDKFQVSCEGIPKNYISSGLGDLISDDDKAMFAMLDPVAWAKHTLDWHCEDPDGSIWKRKTEEGTLGTVTPYIEEVHSELVKLGKSAYNRPYQKEALQCSSRRRVMRWGRQLGKSEVLVVAVLFAACTHKNFNIIIVTPYQVQIDMIFKRLETMIKSSKAISNSIKRNVKAPNYKIELHNGSQISGFTAGTKSGGNADAVRGQAAQMLVLDEMDYLGSQDVASVLSVITNYPNATVWISSTPTGKREKFYDICFENALILTENGLLPIEECYKNQTVLTTEGNYQKINEIMKREVINQNLLTLNFHHSKFIQSISTTENHPFKTLKGWKCAADLNLNDFIAVPTRKKFTTERPIVQFITKTTLEINRFNIINSKLSRKDTARKYNVTERTVSKLWSLSKLIGKEAACYDTRKYNAILNAQKFINNISLSKEFYRLAGYYLAEGNIHRYNKKQYWSGITFTFNNKETDYANEVKKYIKLIFNKEAKISFDHKHHKLNVIVDCNWIALLFFTLFNHSEKKEIPQCMLNNKYELDLVETLFFGDGHHIKTRNRKLSNRKTISLTAKKVILQVYDIYLRNKIPVSFIENKIKRGRKPTFTLLQLEKTHKDKTWKFINNEFYLKIKNIINKNYTGPVYNLDVGTDHTYTANLVGVHNCHNPLYKEIHHPSMMNPLWDDNLEAFFRGEFTSIQYDHEVLALFGEQEQGVYQSIYIDDAMDDYRYEQMRPDPVNWLYTIGVDWNDVKIGTTMCVTGYNPQFNEFRIFTREVISREGWTQHAACQRIIELNRIWNPRSIYVDAGYGGTQYEILTKFGWDALTDREKGKTHPDAKLRNILKSYDFGSKVTIKDLFTKQDVDKPAKPFLIENSVRRFEQRAFKFSKYDTQMENELRGYIIDHVTATGVPVYKQGNEKIGDHNLDALNLSLVAFTLEMSAFGVVSYDNTIKFSGNIGETPQKPNIKNSPEKLTSKPEMQRTAVFTPDFTSKNPAHSVKAGNRRIWSWPGFESDKPYPVTSMRSKSIRTPPSRKKF